jgi:hypothetical protein
MSRKQSFEPPVPKYLPEAMRKFRRVKPKRGQIHHVTIYHEEWCKQLSGLGRCNCNPIVGEPVWEN